MEKNTVHLFFVGHHVLFEFQLPQGGNLLDLLQMVGSNFCKQVPTASRQREFLACLYGGARYALHDEKAHGEIASYSEPLPARALISGTRIDRGNEPGIGFDGTPFYAQLELLDTNSTV